MEKHVLTENTGGEKKKEDRATISEIISEMLDNPNDIGIYPTGRAYDKLESYVHSVRMQAAGWAWAAACSQLDDGEDPRQFDQSILVKRVEDELNIKFEV